MKEKEEKILRQEEAPLLDIRDLIVHYETEDGVVEAVNNVSFQIKKGETFGLIGETGAGKTTIALSIMRLLPTPPAKVIQGSVQLNGEDVYAKTEEDMRKIRGRTVGMIFQDPMTALNPVMRVGDQIAECIELHLDKKEKSYIGLSAAAMLRHFGIPEEQIRQCMRRFETSKDKTQMVPAAIEMLRDAGVPEEQVSKYITDHPNNGQKAYVEQAAKEMLRTVGIPEERYRDYPYQFSGGMKQRVVIAMALACSPELIIADEPTTALDVTIQAQVLTLMKNLKDTYGTSMLMITHDFGVVAEVCDRCAVMYAGEIVEVGTIEDIFDDPRHPYTIGLFGSLPSLQSKETRLKPIKGIMSDPMNLPTYCTFAERCDKCCDRCRQGDPVLTEVSPGHFVKCYLVQGKEGA